MTDPDSWALAAEQAVLDAALLQAPQTGWTPITLRAAGKAARLSGPDLELLMPNGVADLAALLARRHDQRAMDALSAIDPLDLKIRERIARAVAARLDAAAQDAPAVRRWAGYLALPTHLALGLRLLWESADQLWRWAGDVATDENHYSKRAILAVILAGGLAIRLQSGAEAADAFVAARIDNVMAYEKWKAGLAPHHLLRDLAAALGKLRYG
jgi:ubiquinone biosynthesis protein COQ9